MINHRVKGVKHRSLCWLVVAALLLGTTLSSISLAADVVGQSEQEIGELAASNALKTVRATFEYLPRHFTEKDIRTAGGDAEVERLRREYHLGAHFDSEQLAHAMGLADIAWLHRELPVQATLNDLAVSEAKNLIRSVAQSHKGLREDFSYDDYVRIIGQEEVASWSRMLTADFSYADLVETMGPGGASQMRRLYGFKKGASHSEIVRASGLFTAARFVDQKSRTFDFINLKLPVGASADQILQVFVASELKRLQDRFGSAPESSLAEALGREQLKSYAKNFHLPDKFTDAEVLVAAGENAVQQLRDRYDLDEHFTDADIAAAAAADGQAIERINYKLPRGFTAAQDADARRR